MGQNVDQTPVGQETGVQEALSFLGVHRPRFLLQSIGMSELRWQNHDANQRISGFGLKRC